ncbi:hypothetical protein HA402_015311 [Bradysia odoriphaga]|nr:hypothetical protein HA402_015311 [Bradysia odoriphaga]
MALKDDEEQNKNGKRWDNFINENLKCMSNMTISITELKEAVHRLTKCLEKQKCTTPKRTTRKRTKPKKDVVQIGTDSLRIDEPVLEEAFHFDNVNLDEGVAEKCTTPKRTTRKRTTRKRTKPKKDVVQIGTDSLRIDEPVLEEAFHFDNVNLDEGVAEEVHDTKANDPEVNDTETNEAKEGPFHFDNVNLDEGVAEKCTTPKRTTRKRTTRKRTKPKKDVVQIGSDSLRIDEPELEEAFHFDNVNLDEGVAEKCTTPKRTTRKRTKPKKDVVQIGTDSLRIDEPELEEAFHFDNVNLDEGVAEKCTTPNRTTRKRTKPKKDVVEIGTDSLRIDEPELEEAFHFDNVNLDEGVAEYPGEPSFVDDADLIYNGDEAVEELTDTPDDQIIEIIDADKKVNHSKLSEDVEKILADKRYVSGVDINHLDTCYPVIIQSGGNYSLKFSVTSDKNFIHFGAIVCSLGARYKSYCSNISRTLLVNPTDAIQENYNFLLNLEEELLKLLVPGKKLCDVYDAGLSYARKEKPDLVDALTKMFGFGMGIEFGESSIIIGPKCNAIVKKGMVFNVYVGLSPLTNKEATDKEGKTYALFIGDTVLVNDDTAATVLTQSKKTIEDIGIFVKDYDKSIRKLTVSVKEFKTELKDGIDNLRTELKEGQERLVQAVNKLTDFLMGQKTKPKPKNKRQTRLTPAITLSRTSTVEPEIASPISHAIADFEPDEPDIASQAVHDISTQDTASETNVADLDNLDFHEEGGSATTNDVPIRFAPIFTKA